MNLGRVLGPDMDTGGGTGPGRPPVGRPRQGALGGVPGGSVATPHGGPGEPGAGRGPLRGVALAPPTTRG